MKSFRQPRSTAFSPTTSLLATLACILLLFAWTAPLQAASYDIADGDVAGLTTAIDMANDDASLDMISLAANGHYSFTHAYEGTNALPVITSAIVIEGNGATLSRESTVEDFRFLEVGGAGDLVLSNLTLQGGHAASGGAIHNLGTLDMRDCSLTGNQADMVGGALHSESFAYTFITNSNLADNHCGSSGGAVANSQSYLDIAHSNLENNTAEINGGALYSTLSSVAFIDGSTLSGNQARFHGGGIYHYRYARMTITNSTFSGNRVGEAGVGGAIADEFIANAKLTSCSLVNNSGPFASVLYSGGSSEPLIHLAGGNLIANTAPSAGECGGNIAATGFNMGADASCPVVVTARDGLKVGPLQRNGGPTRTHALLPGSMAIDAIDPSSASGLPKVDQRGMTRPLDGNDSATAEYDVGAFEVEPPNLPIDVQPQDEFNVIRLRDSFIDVLIGSTASFDPMRLTAEEMIDVAINFGNAAADQVTDLAHPQKLARHLVDGGLLVHFRTKDVGFSMDSTEGCLTMLFADGRLLRGCDAVSISR